MSMITVRQLDQADKDWLRAEATRWGISMEELVRRLIRERRVESTRKPSQIVDDCFGEKFGVDLESEPRRDDSFRDVDFGEA
jgi:plasmid stability protein